MKKTTQKGSGVSAVWKGSLLALVLTAGFCALGAALILSGTLPQSGLPICGGVCVFLAMLSGSIAVGKSDRRLLWMLLSCALYLAVILLVHLAFIPGGFRNSLWLAAPAILAVLTAFLMTCRRKRGVQPRRR